MNDTDEEFLVNVFKLLKKLKGIIIINIKVILTNSNCTFAFLKDPCEVNSYYCSRFLHFLQT